MFAGMNTKRSVNASLKLGYKKATSKENVSRENSYGNKVKKPVHGLNKCSVGSQQYLGSDS